MSRLRATEPEQRVSLKLRGMQHIGNLYALRLRGGKDGRLASCSRVIREALELANHGFPPVTPPTLPQEPSE